MKTYTFLWAFLLLIVSIDMMAKEELPIPVATEAAKDLKISYELSFPEPHTHYVEVEMKIDNIDQDVLDIKMAVWTPGSYLVREFPKNVETFEVVSGKKTLEYEKIRKNAWRIPTKNVNSLTVKYNIYCFELSVRTSFIDADKAYLNGTSIFMFPDSGIGLPSTVKINPHPDWKEVSTSLKTDGDKWTRKAPNYDILFDAPILIGNQQIHKFTAQGIPHYIAIDGVGNYDPEQMKKDFVRIVDVGTEMFGDNPCEEYTFILLSTENSYGGLEHLNSTSLIYPRWNFEPYNRYVRFLSLAMHEYFHLWNIKRIRPKQLGPFDYENENYTNLLWVAEGFTSYYDEYLLRRAEFISPEDYFKMLENVFNYCENTPGAKVQSLADASFDAWIKYYRKNENSDNCCVSYYTKGAGVAVLMDLAIRNATNSKKSLDDVMRSLYEDFYKKRNVGFTDKEMQEVIKEVAGEPCTEFFDQYIYGVGQLDYNKYLGYAGLELTDNNAGSNRPFLGINTKKEEGKLLISKVDREGAAWSAGLNANDEILAINGYRVSDDISNWIQSFKVGEEITLTISRAGMLREINVKLVANPKHSFRIVKKAKATAKQKALYKAWLGEEF